MVLCQLNVVRGNIVEMDVDVIVNAANSSLLGGGGVDGAIHRAAGPDLKDECRGLNGCETGETKVTGAHRLPHRHIIHTVGPIWRGGDQGEAEFLAGCYRNALDLAVRHACRSVAFPAISTGAFGYPPDQAAEVAVFAVCGVLTEQAGIEQVTFCCFDEQSVAHHESALARYRAG